MSTTRRNPRPGGGTITSRKTNQMASVSKSKYGGRPSVYGSSRTNVLSSASKRSVGAAHSDRSAGIIKPPVQIFDENGADVTPQPLLQQDPNAVKKNQSNIMDSSGGTPTDLMSQASIYNTGTVTASTFGGGPFTR
ncbi:dynein axonemal intermediate chain 4-like [Liolophura sinensis]|uniref:dynein axonemal intermediate chain 4-like n=1 Tax=Liolophura sinensis TaxID=3198878 RepID=UPI003158AAC1